MIKIAKTTTKALQRQLSNLELLAISIAASSSASAAETPAPAETSALLQWTNSIDVRAAFLTSIISIVILYAVGKTDFKSPFGFWGGRFIIFVLVVLNIALWSTQV